MAWVRRSTTLVGLVVFTCARPALGDLTLSFGPSAQTVHHGASVDVAIIISGLEDYQGTPLDAFEFDVAYNDSVLAYDSVTFGDPILGDQLDFGLGTKTNVDDSVSGLVGLSEVSLDSFRSDVIQADSFTLATLTFEAIGGGVSKLLIDLSSPGALDSLGGPLDGTAEAGQITVAPVPPAVLLGALGIGLVVLLRRVHGQETR